MLWFECHLDTGDIVEPCIVPTRLLLSLPDLRIIPNCWLGSALPSPVCRVVSEAVVSELFNANTCITVVVGKVSGEVVVGRSYLQVYTIVAVVLCKVTGKVIPCSTGDVDAVDAVVVGIVIDQVVVVRVVNLYTGDIIEPCIVSNQVVVIAT